MIIFAQYGDEIVNAVGNFIIAVRQDSGNEKYDDVYYGVYFETNPRSIDVNESFCLGLYDSLKQAEAIVEEIFDNFSKGESCFYMPEYEPEIDWREEVNGNE